MIKNILFCVITTILFVFSTHFAYSVNDQFHDGEISSNVISDLKKLTSEVIKRYPKEKYYYVGIGGSPTPLIAMLQELGIDALTIPVSRDGALLGRLKKDEKYRWRFFQHLKNFLPSTEQLNGRRLLVMDYAYSGAALVNFKESLDYYLRHQNVPTSAEYLALTGRAVPVHLDNSINQIKVPSFLENELSNNNGMKQQYREYPSWSANYTKPEYDKPQRLTQYDQLRTQIRIALDNDQDFVRRVNKKDLLRTVYSFCFSLYSKLK